MMINIVTIVCMNVLLREQPFHYERCKKIPGVTHEYVFTLAHCCKHRAYETAYSHTEFYRTSSIS
jgi:hypothetical protein